MRTDEYILCAAIHFDDKNHHLHQPKNIDTGFVVCGRRHHNIFTTVSILSDGDIRPGTYPIIQGFLTSYDRFLTRDEAATMAFAQGLIDKDSGTLISECLY